MVGQVSAPHRVHGIYVGAAVKENFVIGRKQNVWGFDDERKTDDLRVGDRVVFVQDVAADKPVPRGFPRVPPGTYRGTAAALVFAEITEGPTMSKKPVWPDDTYPARFKFRELSALGTTHFSSDEFPAELVDAVRKSATSSSRPYLAVVDDFGPWLNPNVTTQQVADVDVAEIVDSFSQALRSSFITFGAEHESLVRLFMLSLMAKPFVILTGLSGSGKTQIALKLGEWFGESQALIIPVRPDWTGPEFLLGYEDALRKPADDGRRAWSVPSALDFMLKAARDPGRPYLLILDEMNLAHVERYLADVLSGIESRAEVLPNLTLDNGSWLPDPLVPRIAIPRNLFIVGTVNVDETTYLFSPKVLDRANTLEFRVDSTAFPDDPSTARKPQPCSPGPRELVSGLLAIARNDEWHVEHPLADAMEVVRLLRSLHDGLADNSYEFGHRTFYEGIRLLSLLSAAGIVSIDERLDVFVLQKVLPRLHGARRKMEPVVRGLGAFSFDLRAPKSGKDFSLEDVALSQARLPKSMRKLQRMMSALRTNQFASFSD